MNALGVSKVIDYNLKDFMRNGESYDIIAVMGRVSVRLLCSDTCSKLYGFCPALSGYPDKAVLGDSSTQRPAVEPRSG